MKVLILTNFFPPDMVGGYEVGCSQTVEALRLRGHDVTVLTAAPTRYLPAEPHILRCWQRSRFFDSYLLRQSSPVGRHALVTESNFIHAHNVAILLQTLEQVRPDVVYIWNITGVGGLSLLAALHYLQLPWVWKLEDCVPLYLCSQLGGLLPSLASELSQQLQGRFIACSNRLVEELSNHGIALPQSVAVLPNWITGTAPTPRQHFYEGGLLRIVSAGRISRNKGFDVIIEAAHLLRQRGLEQFHIDLYGTVSEDLFENLIRQGNLQHHVFLKGMCRHHDLLDQYANYDVFAFPTYEREPFGVAPLEAAARGCVPIISQQCGIAEWLVGDVHCLKIERTAIALADCWQRILERRIDLRPLGRRAMSTAWRDFHIDTQIPRIEAILQETVRPYHVATNAIEECHRLASFAEKLIHLLVQDYYVPTDNQKAA